MKYAVVLNRRLRSISLWITATLAVATLPPTLFPPGWIAAFVLPALLLFVLRRRFHLQMHWAIAAASILHVGTILVAQTSFGAIGRETALGCSLLPPLTFLAARRRRDDATWALFLALCTFLIAVILGNPPGLLQWAFIGSAITTLQLDTSARRLAARERGFAASFAPRRSTLLSLGTMVAVTIAVCALCLNAVVLLGELAAGDDDWASSDRAARSGDAQVGLSNEFEFGAASASILDIKYEELVRVRSADGPRHRELYLRTGHFELAGLDRWSPASPNDRRVVAGSSIRHRGDVQDGVPVDALDVLITGPAEEFLFLPPGTMEVIGLEHAVGSLSRERLARLGPEPVRYGVRFQDRREAVGRRPFDSDFVNLTRPTYEIERQYHHFFDLLNEAGVGPNHVGTPPAQIAAKIIDALHARCRYELREPDGPSEHSIINFLSGDKSGFCMHFASALAISLRIAGVPSRVAVGLYAGPSEPQGEDGTMILGSQHAHAWTEIPIEGLGWVIFDPTPAAHAGIAGRASALPEAEIEADTGLFASMRDWIDLHTALWILLSCCSLVTVVALVTSWRRGPSSTFAERANVDRRALSSIRTLLNLLHRWQPRQPRQSLWDYAGSLRGVEPLPIESVEAAFAAYEEVRFGDRPFDDARRARVREAIAAVRDVPRPRD